MPILSLNFKDRTIGDYQMQKGLSLTIGRLKNNDVVIENLAVSGHHAKIDSVGDGFVLIDLQSKNGSFVNEKIINTYWLKDGDVISIGKHSLVFKFSEGEQIRDNGSEKMEKTMVMDTSQYRSMMKKSKPIGPIQSKPKGLAQSNPNGPRSKPIGPEPAARHNNIGSVVGLAFLAGGSGSIKLSRIITKIGKHPDSDIVLKGLWVGQTAVTISKRPDGFYLSYVEGFAKPHVNGKTVKHSIILNDLDIIDIGSTKLQFHNLHRNKTRMLKIKKKARTAAPSAR